MLIGEGCAAIGVAEPEDRDVAIMVRTNGAYRHAPLRRVLDRDMAQYEAVYVAGGLFERGSIKVDSGRRWSNVREVRWLAFDCDLSSFSGRDASLLHDMSGTTLDTMIDEQMRYVVDVFAAAALPIHRLDMTGYGLCAYTMLDVPDWGRLDEIKGMYPLAIAVLNERAGMELVDRQVSDAGTRVTRIPGSLNNKGDAPRTVRTLLQTTGTIGVDGMRSLVGAGMQRRLPTRAVVADQDAPDGLVDALVDAVASEWTEGGRHRVALGLAGMLAKAGLAEEDAERVIEQVATRAGDDDIRDRLLAVRTTYARQRGGMDVQGYHTLRETVTEGTLAAIDALLRPLREATAPRITLGDGGSGRAVGLASSRPRFSEPPDAAWRGWIGEYMEIMAPTTEAADAFHLGVGLTVAGAALGRTVRGRYAGGEIYPNLFSLLIGSAGGSRKDTAISRGVPWPRIMERGGLMGTATESPYHLFSDAGSSQALIDVLAEQPNGLLYLSEFARLTRNARRQGTSDLIPTLLLAFDNPPQLQVVSRGKPALALNPCLSLIGAIQPDILSIEFGENDTSSGFTSRLLYFCGEGKDVALPDPPPPDGARLAGLYRQLLEIREEGRELRQDGTAGDAWDEFYLTDRRRIVDGVTQDTMRTRLALLVRKVALIYAATERCDCIMREHLEAAIAVVEWQWANVCLLSGDWGASVGQAIERKVLSVLREHGAMPRRTLWELVRSPRWGVEQFSAVMRAMADTGIVVQDALGTVALTEGGR